MRSQTLRKRGLQKSRKSRKSRRVQYGGLCPVGCIADPEYHLSNSASNSASNSNSNSVPLSKDEEECIANFFTASGKGKTTLYFKDFKNSIKPINNFIQSRSTLTNQDKAELIEFINTNLVNITTLINNANKLLKSSICDNEVKKSIKSLLMPLYKVYSYTQKPEAIADLKWALQNIRGFQTSTKQSLASVK